ncbi:MAG TPA: sugar phosphate isomerase/epimerase [Bryobacteraceae bacterium]
MHQLSRRRFVAFAAAAPLGLGAGTKVPVGLEMYSVRGELMKDLLGTVRAVAKTGYQVVEFYAPYFSWTAAQAKEVRKLMDDLGIRCNSTHNNTPSFTGDGLPKAIEFNQILGSKYIVMASAGPVNGVEGWKALAGQLTKVVDQLRPLGMSSGYHNHAAEWARVERVRPMDILAANTPQDFMLQLDVGTCVEAKADPVEWINAHPGRIRSIHCKDWAAGAGPDKGYRCLFGEGNSPWAKIFEAAEAGGGVEYYLIEQEGSRYPEFETAERCLATWKKLRG